MDKKNENLKINWNLLITRIGFVVILFCIALGGYKIAVDNLNADMKESISNDKVHMLKINTLENQYTNIEKWMVRLDKKIDEIPRR